MARAGDTFENPLTGITGTVLAGSDDSGSARNRTELVLPSGARLLPAHAHPEAHERLRVVEGRIALRIGRERRELGPGDEADIPAGTVHDWWNDGPGEARVVVDTAPGARFEALMTTLIALVHEGRTNAAGTPHLLQLAVVLRAYGDVIRLASVPRGIGALALTPIWLLGRMHGYRADHVREDTPHCQLARGGEAVEGRRSTRRRPRPVAPAGEVVAA
jgi:mannose-6-phosphate isomerase-like protein (cupin superfamily)